jgi:hypothetical protein
MILRWLIITLALLLTAACNLSDDEPVTGEACPGQEGDVRRGLRCTNGVWVVDTANGTENDGENQTNQNQTNQNQTNQTNQNQTNQNQTNQNQTNQTNQNQTNQNQTNQNQTNQTNQNQDPDPRDADLHNQTYVPAFTQVGFVYTAGLIESNAYFIYNCGCFFDDFGFDSASECESENLETYDFVYLAACIDEISDFFFPPPPGVQDWLDCYESAYLDLLSCYDHFPDEGVCSDEVAFAFLECEAPAFERLEECHSLDLSDEDAFWLDELDEELAHCY